MQIIDTSLPKIVTYITFLLFISLCEIVAQCDCPGNIPAPMISISSGAVNNARAMLDKNELYISMSYRYIYGDLKFENDIIQENNFKSNLSYNISNFSATYGIINRLNATIELPFINTISKDYYSNKSSYNLSASLQAKYNIFSKDYDDEFILYSGIKVPIIKSSIDTSGVSGIYNSSNTAFIGLLYNYLVTSNVNLILNLYKDFNFAGNNEIKQGDAFAGNLIIKYTNLFNFTPSLSFDFIYSEHNLFKKENIYSSGYKSLFATASIFYSIPKLLTSAGVSFSYPIYRYYNGYQTSQDYIIQLSLGILFL